MANVAISGLPVTTSMTDSSILPVVVSGTTSQISGANLKAYIGASSAGGTMNYSQTLGTQVTTSTTGTLVSTTITTSGAPVFITAVGDANPQGGYAWCRLQLARGGTLIGGIVQAENNSNLNVPYCVEFIDTPAAGTHVYTLEVETIFGTLQFGEADGPTIIALELTSGSGATPAGANTQVQFNDAGALAGDAVFTFDKVTGELTTTSLLATGNVDGATLTSTNSVANEGGQINLALPVNTTLAGTSIIIDSFIDSIRFFEGGGGTAKGMLIDVGNLSAGQLPIGYRDIPQVVQTSAYTVALTDMGKHVYATATMTATIPANSSVAFPVGATVAFIAGPTSTMTIAITSDTMYLAGVGTTGSRTLAPFGMATAVKVTSTTWFISGNGLT